MNFFLKNLSSGGYMTVCRSRSIIYLSIYYMKKLNKDINLYFIMKELNIY